MKETLEELLLHAKTPADQVQIRERFEHYEKCIQEWEEARAKIVPALTRHDQELAKLQQTIATLHQELQDIYAAERHARTQMNVAYGNLNLTLNRARQ